MSDFLDLEQKFDPELRVSVFNSNFTLSDPKIDSSGVKSEVKENGKSFKLLY